MKRIISLPLALFFLCLSVLAHAGQLEDMLRALPAVKQIDTLSTNRFAEKYVIRFQHPVSYGNPAAGTFEQRVIIGHKGFDRPTVMVTEGYGAAYALNPHYSEELCEILDANLVFVEYRYFLESTPNPCDWNHLTVWNSLNDLHEVRTALSPIYNRKWLATGVSKGGMTSLFYRAYFPDDVAATVPYVAPLNASVEDGRHEPFISRTAGTPEQRRCILDYQTELLKRKSRLMPLFTDYCQGKNYRFNAPLEEIYDYCVLELSFSIWQWGTPVQKLASDQADDADLLNNFLALCDPSYFQPEGTNLSFFVQAARELGYYGYDLTPFRGLTSIRSTKGYLSRLMLPADMPHWRFSKKLYKHTRRFLRRSDPTIMFIYGENDPWSASGVITWLDFSHKKEMCAFVDPAGSHASRLSTMPPSLRDAAIARLRRWME
ncbi:MAG: hypothetical protein NC388_01280 [Clostridium sp.]|nr:hypothetical protein [Clostridium sp.]